MNADTTVFPSAPDWARQRAATVRVRARITCTIAEACSASGLGRTKIYDAINADLIQTRRIGRRRLVVVQSLLQWLAA